MKRLLIIILLVISIFLTVIYNLNSNKININTCSKQALIDLPSVGNVLSDRIIQGRPYKDVNELKNIKGIGDKTFETIKNRVVAK